MKTMFLNQRKVVAKALLAAMLVTAGTGIALAADAPAGGAPQKVAVLDIGAALFNSDRAKAAEQEIQAQTSEDQTKIRSLADEAKALQEKAEKDAAVMSDEEKRKVGEQIQEIGVQYQFLVEKIQKLRQDRSQQFQQTYQPNLVQAISEIVEEGHYDLVLRSEAVIHFAGAYDITARVTEKLNAQK